MSRGMASGAMVAAPTILPGLMVSTYMTAWWSTVVALVSATRTARTKPCSAGKTMATGFRGGVIMCIVVISTFATRRTLGWSTISLVTTLIGSAYAPPTRAALAV